MATGGYDRAVDSRVTCSICLEPYKGRHPKLLQCFHTFCSPCLTQLAHRETPRSKQFTPPGGDPDDSETRVSITCPTCRTPTPLPPGGVASLQTNFYLDDGDDQGDLRPLLCDLCEEGQEAKFTCSKCLACFCTRCRRFHDKLCKSSQVSEVKARPGVEDRRQVTQESRQQVQLLEDVLKKLGQEEKRLAQERRAREHDIHVRYATVLRHAAETRDAGLINLRDTTQVLNDAMQADITQARDMLSRMKQQTSKREMTDSTSEILTDANREHFEMLVQKNEDESLLTHNPTNPSTESLLRCLGGFIGTVVITGQDSNENLDTDKVDSALDSDRRLQSPEGLSPERPPATAQKQDSDQKDTARYAQLETLVMTSLTTLQNQNALLCRDLTSLQTEVGSLKNAGKKVHDDLTSLQRDQVSLRDKHALLRSDMDNNQDKVLTDVKILQTDQTKLHTDVNTLQMDKTKLQTDVNTLQTDQTKLQTDVNTLQTDQTELQTDVNTLQTDHSKLQTDVNTLQTDQTKLQTDVNTHQTDQTKVQTDVNTLQTDQTKLQTDVNTLQTDQGQLQTDQAKLGADFGNMKKDMGDLNQKSSKMGQDVIALQDWLKRDDTALSMLESKLSKLNVQVAFHAMLTNTVTLTGEQTVICDKVITSVGGGYNSQTGVFTAPVSGTYCFMATSSPGSDVKEWSGMWIVMEGKETGWLVAVGRKTLSSAHTAVQVKAGHKVWLKSLTTVDDQANTFLRASTTFTGMLLQPEL